MEGCMARRFTGSRGEGGGRDTPLVQVPADLRSSEDEDIDERSGHEAGHPFERDDVHDQGAPDGRGAHDRRARRRDDPADPSSEPYPDDEPHR
jgi:hypothetical protein